LRADFEREYTQLFARTIPNAEIEILTWTLSLGTSAEPGPALQPPIATSAATPVARRKVYDPQSGRYVDIPVYLRSTLGEGARLSGPAVVVEDETTTMVTASFDASINGAGCIVLDRKKS